MAEKIYNVLFVCTGNSARSIIAEALLNCSGKGRFVAYSAGSHPKGAVHPFALSALQRLQLPTEGYRSKSWDELRSLTLLHSTSSLLFATRLPGRCVPHGPDSR